MSVWKMSGVLLIWGTAMIGVLQLQWLPISSAHGVCGPWGCGPPVSALFAYHGFWLVFLSLPVGVMCRILSPAHLRRFGVWGVLGALLGILAICIWQRFTWWPVVTDWQREYFLTRCGFMVITMVDVPLLQIMLASAICGLVGFSSRSRDPHTWESRSDQELLDSMESASDLSISSEHR